MNEFQHAGSSTIDLEAAIQAEEGMVVRLLHQLEELYRSGSATIDSLSPPHGINKSSARFLNRTRVIVDPDEIPMK